MNIASISESLQRLLDDNPADAIAEASKLDGGINIDLLKATIFVDGGAMLKDFDVVANLDISSYYNNTFMAPRSATFKNIHQNLS